MLNRNTGLLLATAAFVVSCGGGGGGGSGGSTPAPPAAQVLCNNAGATYGTWVSPAPAVGKNAAATVAGCTGAIVSPQWVQTAGPAVMLIADKSQTISFDPPQAGSYTFRVSFTDPAGVARTETVSIDVAAAAAPATRMTLRASQSVRMGGPVSVRAWPQLADGDSVSTITWTQIEGPTVQLDTRSSRVALFTAPAVTRDTPIRLRASLRSSSGGTDSDEVLVLVERSVQAAASDNTALWGGEHVQRTHAYRADSPYAAALVRCAYDAAQVVSGVGNNLCPLSQLPYLAQDSQGGIPSVEQVMNRVLVSHDWLGRNFEAFLRAQDGNGDLRRMLNSVTAIVLGTQLRPSFYHPVSGAIYLDADTFWLTAEERDTINEQPDYRSDFGSELQFRGLWRYVQNNQNIFAYFNPELRTTRALSDVRNDSTWLMFHELSHALDYLPPARYAGLVPAQSAWGNIAQRYANRQLASDTLSVNFPLTSSVMFGLGQVMYQGVMPTALEKAYTATQVGAHFSADRATDDYAYSDPAEDLAMTQEEFLMNRRLGIRRDVAYTDTASTDAVVRWGQRGRVGDTLIKPRTRSIITSLLPWLDPAEVDLLPAPEPMLVGAPWRSNLVQPALPRQDQALNGAPDLMEMWRMKKQMQRLQQHRQRAARALPVQRIDPPTLISR